MTMAECVTLLRQRWLMYPSTWTVVGGIFFDSHQPQSVNIAVVLYLIITSQGLWTFDLSDYTALYSFILTLTSLFLDYALVCCLP